MFARPQKLMRLDSVLARTALGKTFVYELIAEGAFPAPVKVGRSSRWREEEIDDWIRQLKRAA